MRNIILLISLFSFSLLGCREQCPRCVGEGKVACHRCHGTNIEDCSRCYASGKIDCSTCYGQGKVNCSRCSGSGKYYGYEYGYTGSSYEFFLGYHKCNDCSSTGKVNCNQCYSSGKVNCPNCGADGKKPCTACFGKLTEVCGLCGGEGTIESSKLIEENPKKEEKVDGKEKVILEDSDISLEKAPVVNILTVYNFQESERNIYGAKDVIVAFFKAIDERNYEAAYDYTWVSRFEKKGKDWFVSCKAYGCTYDIYLTELKSLGKNGEIENFEVRYSSKDDSNGDGEWIQILSVSRKGEENALFITDIKNQEIQ